MFGVANIEVASSSSKSYKKMNDKKYGWKRNLCKVESVSTRRIECNLAPKENA